MEPIEVMLGERQFVIEEPSINGGERWRKLLGEPLDDVVEMVSALDADLESIADVQAVLPRVRSLLMGSVKQIAELVCAYDEGFTAEAGYILDNATGSQVMEAFVVMLKMAFPFGEALRELLRMSRGPAAAPTSMSSPALNGADGQTSSAKHS